MLSVRYRFALVLLLFFMPLFAATRPYVLCEGNYMTTNASLWSYSESAMSLVGFPGGILGDTGQSLTIDDDQLYVVCNNSNNIEVLDLSHEGESRERTILLTNASPRYIAFTDNAAYISCWLLPGILVLDRNNDMPIDTIYTDGKPEDLLVVGDSLYVSLIEEKTSYDKNNKVLEIDIRDDATVRRTFTVAAGPEHLVYHDSVIYVGSTRYDEDWNALIALSKIDLQSGDVLINDLEQTTGYNGSDLILEDDTLYYAIQNGIYTIDTTTLEPSNDPIIQVDSTLFIYSLAKNSGTFYLGLTDDYIAPDYVYRYNAQGDFLGQFSVGASPGDYAFYNIVDTVSAVDDVIADAFELAAPYPNPFNHQVSIPFRLSEANIARISVFSLEGKCVHESYIAVNTSDWQEYSWNAYDVPSGVYLVNVAVENTVFNKKIVLLK